MKYIAGNVIGFYVMIVVPKEIISNATNCKGNVLQWILHYKTEINIIWLLHFLRLTLVDSINLLECAIPACHKNPVVAMLAMLEVDF